MIDIVDFLYNLNGWDLATLISVALFIERSYHNRELRNMVRQIGDKVGVEWESNLRRNGLKFICPKPIYCLHNGKKHQNPRRKKTMEKLKSRKLWLALFGAIIPVLNVQLGINLAPNIIFGILAVIISGITALAHVDGKKALAAVATLKSSVPVDPNATYRDMFPTIKAVHDGINKLLEGAKIEDKYALSAYGPILDIIKSIEHPQPVETIPAQQESA